MERVAFGITTAAYNTAPPFHPDTAYPELPFTEVSAQPNHPYQLLRKLLERLGLDQPHQGTPQWNPLGELIQPGQTVLLKPNFVINFNASGGDLFAVITHPSILRALVDYAYLALRGQGRLVIADAPQMDSNWGKLLAGLQLEMVREFYRSRFDFDIELYDLREFAVINPSQPAYSGNRQKLPGDPSGSVLVNLGRDSAFYGQPSENYYGADYDRTETIRCHQGETHAYTVSKTALAADVIISVPKMKVHKKVGVTLNLKGMVGITTNKNCLVHYRIGTPREGGDQLPDNTPQTRRRIIKAQRWLFDHALARQTPFGDAMYRIARTGYRVCLRPFLPCPASPFSYDGGDWHGNNSAWRMAADLAKILFFADANGKLHRTPQRRLFCVVDGIIGGENCGPLAPDAKPAGCLVAGANPVAVDLVTTRLMGFDVTKLRQFDLIASPSWDFGLRSVTDIEVVGENGSIRGTDFFNAAYTGPVFHFKPHPGWIGHIEQPTRS